MLAKLGCTYVVVGHSERREYHAETDEVVNDKVKAAFQHGLIPILCVGEGLEVRQEGGPGGLRPRPGRDGLVDVTAEQARRIVVAYEPVWAIGTGEVATPADAQEVCAAIRTRLAELYAGDLADGVRVLYGGSVKAPTSRHHGPAGRRRRAGRWREPRPGEFASICRFRDHVTV